MMSELVDTRLGPLVFDDGRPSPDKVDRLYDFVDLMRGVQAFRDVVPAASLEAMRAGLAEQRIDGCHQC
jgi:hypothetical protein